MMRLLVDTNILFDYFARRHPFDRDAELLLFGCAMGDYELWVSSSQITDLFYLMTHGNESLSRDQGIRVLKRLREHVRIAALTEDDVDDALVGGWRDFEDACVYAVAKRIKANALLTRNKVDFGNSVIPVWDAGEFLDMFSRENNIYYDEVGLDGEGCEGEEREGEGLLLGT